MQKNLVVFDFDGTITFKDSLPEIIKFQKGILAFWMGVIILSPVLVLFKLGFIPNQRAKEYVLSFFFKNDDLKRFQKKCTRFSLERLPQIVKESALECIQKHQESGDRVMIVTASAENWLSSWCEKMKVELIASRLQIKNNRLTGKIEGTNCFGPEKVKRLTEKVDIKSFDKIYVYADSKGDKELLDVADYPFYKSFK